LALQDDVCFPFLFIYSPLFEPEAFHTGNYTEITHKQKSPTNVGLDVIIDTK